MGLKKTSRLLALVLVTLLFSRTGTITADPGHEITKACRVNIKTLNEAVEKYLKDGHGNLPRWAPYKDMQTMVLSKYIDKKPVPPTLDCEYFFVGMNPENYDWYCNIHGVLGGNRSITFRYHEFEFKAFINDKYLEVAKYKSHVDNVIRWCSYSPTLMESIKFSYSRNPLTTVLITAFGLFAAYFVYRNIFE